MTEKTIQGRGAGRVKQLSVFTANRLGRLHDLVSLLSSGSVHILALTILDATDSATIRFVVDDLDRARELLHTQAIPFTESELVVVEIDAATKLNDLMAVLLQAELNVHYLYSFIPHPRGKSLLALNLEDNDMGEQALRRHQFEVLRQSDITR